jgi:cell division initiation protein
VDETKKITAQDLRHQDFSIKMRGYDRDEVDEFLATVADFLEKDAAERAELRQKIESVESQLREFKDLEGTLKNTLLRTQESADDVRRAAERESELIIREAQVKADRMIDERRSKLNQLEASFDALRLKWNEYFVQFKNLLSSNLELLDKMQHDYDSIAGSEKKNLSNNSTLEGEKGENK